MLDHEQAGAGDVAQAERARARALRSRAARSPPRARRAGSPRAARRSGTRGRRCAGSRWRARRRTCRGTSPSPMVVDELVGTPAEPAFGARDVRRVQRREHGIPERQLVVERDAQRLVDGERAEEPCVLERARQAEPGTRRRAQAGQVAAAEQDPSLVRARGSPRPRRTAWSCPRRSVRSARGSRRRAARCVTSSSAITPAKRLRGSFDRQRHAARVVRSLTGRGDGRYRRRLSGAAPSRKIERRRSGRSSRSAVSPWKRIVPFSRK